MLAYRSSEHESTGHSPNLMMLGREPELPVDLLNGPPPVNIQESCASIVDLRGKLIRINCLSREKMLRASDKQKRTYDHRLNEHLYKGGSDIAADKAKKGSCPKITVWLGGSLSCGSKAYRSSLQNKKRSSVRDKTCAS